MPSLLRRPGARPAQRPARAPAVAVAVVVLLVDVVGPARAAAEPAGPYAPPVDGPVVDPFRAPPSPYGAGNRGVDYATPPGSPVQSAAAGEVTFAGRVGLGLHVVVLHPDGVRTSYSFLAEVAVRRGDAVERGGVVGRAGATVHWGARVGDRYVDPLSLLDAGPPDVHLVPVALRSAGSEADERAGLLDGLPRPITALWATAGRASAVGADAVAWAAGAATGREALLRAIAVRAAEVSWAQLTAEIQALAPVQAARLLGQARRYLGAQADCTPADRAPPPPPGERRIAVLVGGFGSRSGAAAVLDVDTAALGYAPVDVAQFSYRGGRAAGVGAVAGVPVSTYGPADAGGDLRTAADRLRALVAAIARAHPGVPVDVVAHSQGGLVARAALARDSSRHDPGPAVAHLVTLGTPHDGADVASANAALATTAPGRAGSSLVAWASGGTVDGGTTSAAQLAERSAFLADVAGRPLPVGTAVTSIAADGDLVVPALHSSLAGATNALVPLGGLDAHTRLPAAPATTRELALALAGRRPTCRDVGAGLVRAALTSWAEDAAGAATVDGARWLGGGAVPLPGSVPPRPPLPGP